jgi:4'-phosphopantetheinyl transferase
MSDGVNVAAHFQHAHCPIMAADITLARDETAVWWMATDKVEYADLDRWLKMLDHEERDRSGRFHLATDRRDFIAAHVLLRSMLSSYVNSPAHQWRFTCDVHGKPRIDPHIRCGELAFNLSHTQGLVAAAVAAHGTVGVDVEQIDPAKADFAMVEEYFAPAEAEMLKAVPDADRTVCFFHLWTLKEAYIKAIGTGLNTPLNSFAFRFEPIRIEFDSDTLGSDTLGHAVKWQFAVLPTTDKHVLSVAVGREAGDVRITSRAVAPQNL